VREAAPAMTPEFYPVQEGHKILLAKSPKDDPKVKYRKEVERLIKRGKFSIPARRLLNSLSCQLKLDAEVAAAIEAEVQQPYLEYQRKLEEYEETLIEAMEAESTLSERTLNDLRDYQQFLGLRNEDVAVIHRRVIGEGKAEYECRHDQTEQSQQAQERPSDDKNDLQSEIGIDYTKLKSLLEANNWEEADRETANIMLKVADREDKEELDSESIENFSSTDLLTINQLWEKYSKGQFGFSVQKQVFDRLEKDVKDFGECVGWKAKEFGGVFSWKSRSQLIFKLDAPVGHLPWSWANLKNKFEMATDGSKRRVKALLSRRDL
jgi:hypothetical protein